MSTSTNHFDSYGELGVGRGATAKDVKVAFRKRSKKTHPDNGGSAEAFEMTTRALAILVDPARRKHFDETGSTETPEADNKRARALGVVERFMSEVVDGFLNAPPGTVRDPRIRPLLLEFTAKIAGEIEKGRRSIDKGETLKAYLADLARRFDTTDPGDPVRRMFERRLRDVGAECERLKAAIEMRQDAIEIIAAYKFKADNG